MRFQSAIQLTLAFFFGTRTCAQSTADPASFVNLFIGTTNGGHVFPGATLPHGMVKAGMDTDTPGAQAGYDSDPSFNVTGFSSLHNSGTGGSVSLSHFKIFPSINGGAFQDCPTSLNNRKVLRKTLSNGTADDFASPGYFSTNLTTGVRVELTATAKASIQRHTFPASTDGSPPRIIVDVTSAAGNTGTLPTLQINSTSGQVAVVISRTGSGPDDTLFLDA
ncbi:hypothetical protein OF83DRAFT_745538 [Amylostereum chailletii]|nr:hypothetical protein OF83DRAFT_745538 [Amylostereum chailletii]